MIVQIVDNHDLMLVLNAPTVDLNALQKQGLFAKQYAISENSWLLRCGLDKFGALKTALEHKVYKMVVVRFTSGSTYFSSDSQDQSSGQNITG